MKFRLLLLFLFLFTRHVFAQEWPARPVKFILSQASGTSPDITARFLADRLSRLWNRPVVIENRPGGQNVPGAQAAARSPADGYNFFYATTAAIVSNPFTFKALPYDPERDFAPVAMIAKSPMVVAVNPAVAAKTLAELVALDKSQPGKLAAANEGAKTFSGLMSQMLNQVAGIRLLQVPYSGVSPAIQDTIAGRTQVVLVSSAALLPYLKRGELRALAVSAGKRVRGMDDVPTSGGDVSGFRVRRLVCAPRARRHPGRYHPAREPGHGPGARRSRGGAAPVRLRPRQRRRRHARIAERIPARGTRTLGETGEGHRAAARIARIYRTIASGSPGLPASTKPIS